MSLNRNGKPVLSIEKLSVFDFLIQHPYILFSILQNENKKNNLVLTEVESNSISKEYPNTDSLFSFDKIRKLLQILIGYGFCEVKLLDDSTLVFMISSKGKDLLNEIDSIYGNRLGELAKELRFLQAESYKKLISSIKPYTNGK